MTLLKSLPASYEYLITATEMVLIKDLMMDYMTTYLMHKMSKRKEKKSCEDVWYRDKQKAASHFRAKVQNHVSIVANRATLRVFATKQTRSENKQRMRGR